MRHSSSPAVAPSLAHGAICFLLACLPRAWAWWHFPAPEPNYHYWLSDSLLTGRAFAFGGDPTSFIEPVYPAFLAILRAACGSDALALLCQALIASTGAPALYLLGRRLSGSAAAGMWAAGFYAFDPYFVRQSSSYLELPLLLPLFLWAIERFTSIRGLAGAAAAGGLFGLLFLARASLGPVCLAAVALLAARRGRREALVAATVLLAVVLPWSVRSWKLGHGPLPTRAGENLFLSTSEYAIGVVPVYDIDLLGRFAQIRLDQVAGEANPALTEAAADRILVREALVFAAAHPWQTLGLKLRNLIWIPSPLLLPRNAKSDYTHAALVNGRMQITGLRRRPWPWEAVHALFRSAVLLFAVAGARQRLRPGGGLLPAALAAEIAVHTVFFPTTRLLGPLTSLLMVYAGVGAQSLAARGISWGRRRGLGAPLAPARPAPTTVT